MNYFLARMNKFYKHFAKIHKYYGEQTPSYAISKAKTFITKMNETEDYRRIIQSQSDDLRLDLSLDLDFMDCDHRDRVINAAAELIMAIGALGYHYEFSMGEVEERILKKFEKMDE